MLGTPPDTNANSLSGFQFTTIGKPPSLLARITSEVNGSQEPVASPPSSPLASPKMTVPHAVPSTSPSNWFVALSNPPDEARLDQASQTVQSATRTPDAGGSTTSHHGLPARPSAAVIGKAEQHKPSRTPIAKRTSRPSPSLPAQSSASSSALRPALSATPDRSPILPPHSGVALAHPSHAVSMSPASIDKPLPQDDHEADDESFHKEIARLGSGVTELTRLHAEARCVGADLQDKYARVHACAQALAEQFRSRQANTECRVARANQRADELERKLDEAHNTITRLEGENGDLRGEMDRLRAEQDQLRGERDKLSGERGRLRGEVDRLRGELDLVHGELDQVRGELERVRIQAGKDDALVNEALKSSQEAIRETELARARWAVVQKKLEDQLAVQKRDAATDKEALLAHIEELKRAVKDAKRQAAVLVEEKLKLEVQIQADVDRRKHSDGSQQPGNQRSDQRLSVAGAEMVEGNEQTHRKLTDPASHQSQPDYQVPHVSSLPGSVSSPSSTLSTSHSQVCREPPSARPTIDGDGATQRRPRGKLLHLSDDGLSHPNMSPPNELLLAVKDEGEDEVKAKVEPVEDASSALSYASHHPPPVREPRREQSLDYAPMQQEPRQSSPIQQLVPDSTTLSDFASSHAKEQSPGSPVVSLGRHSLELAYPSRRSSYEPTSPPREPSPAPFSQAPSAPPPVLAHPRPQSSTNPQLAGERRGPITPPLENAPSVQAKRLIRRPERQQQAPQSGQTTDSAALPTRPTQYPAQRSSSPPVRRASDSWRPPRDHESRPQVRYSDESRDRHKRRRDDDADIRPPAARRARLTPPPREDHYAPAHDIYPPPVNKPTPQNFDRRTPPRQFSNDRTHYQSPPLQEYQDYNVPPSGDERTYVPTSNGRARRRADHYSPPQQRYSPDISTTGYAPEREARAAPLPDTEPPHPQMAPPLAQRLQGNANAPVYEQPVASKPVSESRPPGTNGPAPRARRQAKRPASRSPSPKRSPPATSSQEPILTASVSVPLLQRFSDSKTQTHAPASRGRGSGRGRGQRGRGGQPQQRQSAERPQKSLEERLSTNRNPNANHEGGGGLMNRIQPR